MSSRGTQGRPAARLAYWLPVFLSCAACGEPPPRQLCRFGPEKMLVKGGGSYIRAVALARGGTESLLAAWTDASGVWVLPIDAQGSPRGKQVRIGFELKDADLFSFRFAD